ncbi:MAG: LysR family transcriptional regulator [Sphaerochaetaceae bacterium]|jgi:DNA-binding transcriptional LysR family regulator
MLDQKIITFLKVVDTRSFTNAATALNLTQPAISHHIRQLEEEYSAKLFQRTQKGLHLTLEGEIVLKYARRAFASYEKALIALEDSKRNITSLIVGMTATATENMLPQVMLEYTKIHSKTKVRIETGTLESLRTQLLLHEIDMAIAGGSLADNEFSSLKIDTDYLKLIVSPDNPLAQENDVSLDRLKQEKLILRPVETATRRRFEEFLFDNHETINNYNVVMEIDNVSVIKDLVSNDQGVTVMSHNAALMEQLTGSLVGVPLHASLQTSMIREIYIVYRNDYSYPEIAHEIKDIYLRMKEEGKI